MRYFSTFSGVGGFELGIEMAYAKDRWLENKTGQDVRLECSRPEEGHDPRERDLLKKCGSRFPDKTCPEFVGFSEVDKYASAVLRYRFPNVKNYGDIAKIDWATVPDFDLLVGGSPCQDFSVAGKREGITGRRSGLFGEFVRALEAKRPDSFIWENVKGVMSSGRGWDFARILSAFSEAGYSLWWQVLNAKDFGVPQNRERVFVVGTRVNLGSPREVFFETSTAGKGLVEITQRAPDARRVYDPDGIGRTLKALGGGEGAKTMLIRCPLRYLNRNQKNIEGDYAFTVDASQTAGVTDGMRVRRLTPVETERLMSWPDDWTKIGVVDTDVACAEIKEISDTQRYKMCGNGVVSKVVAEVYKAHFL